jgi:RNA polymerase sigma-70 factor (ECF subfamily)
VELHSTSTPPYPRLAGTDRFATLFEEHSSFVARTLRRLGVPDSDVEDALQEVFLIAQSKLDSIELGKEKAFLFGTARRRASTVRRSFDRTSRRIEIALEGYGESEPGPDSTERTNERHARAVLDEVLDALPFDLRTVLVLHELEEMDLGEIAEMIGIPVGTVASRLRRAREKFEVEADRVRTRLALEDRQ